MSERYNDATARHYAAYRPPLHRLILRRVIGSSESFRSGLDVGCGTGYSAAALADYCDRVCGMDVSQQMLNHAAEHPKVSYQLGNTRSFENLPGHPYDIVTFAGSLFYTKSEGLRVALRSACAPSATVIVYDFNVQVDDLMRYLDVTGLSETSDYDHDIGLSDWEEYEACNIGADRIRIDVSPVEAAHVLLSDSHRYDLIKSSRKEQDVFEGLTRKLVVKDGGTFLDVDIWCKRYRLMAPN